jgi:hypothetical protein
VAITAQFAKADFGGFLYDPTGLSQRDMPTVAQTFSELPSLANGLEAEFLISNLHVCTC